MSGPTENGGTRRRILAIDGGGIKGVFPAAFLAELEAGLAHPIGSYFDLIVGTSTGGILALGLGLGFRATELVAFYEKFGPQIFGGNRLLRWIAHWGLRKYPREPLVAALRATFGDRLLGHATTRLVVPSLSLATGEVYIFKTAHDPRFRTDLRRSAVDVALATAAAPSYFPAFPLGESVPLVDGGVWANNPAGLAAVEAVGVLGWSREDTTLLSIGCTRAAFHGGLARSVPLGRFYWAGKFIDAAFAGQDSASHGTAKLLLGRENLIRVNPTVATALPLDAVETIDELKGLAHEHARSAGPEIHRRFLAAPAQAFEPFERVS